MATESSERVEASRKAFEKTTDILETLPITKKLNATKKEFEEAWKTIFGTEWYDVCVFPIEHSHLSPADQTQFEILITAKKEWDEIFAEYRVDPDVKVAIANQEIAYNACLALGIVLEE